MNILFGSGKTVPEKYNNADGKMPFLDGVDQINVSFDALGGKQAGKYRITAEKVRFKDGQGEIVKYTQYVVNPNDNSATKAVVAAIVSDINVAGPGPEHEPEPGPQATIAKLLQEIETGLANTSVDISKIIENAESIKKEADAIKAAAADAIKAAAADEIKTAADEIKTAADEIRAEHDKGEAKKDDEAAVKASIEYLYAKIKTAVATIKTAVAKIRALIGATATTGGYNSAKSAAPKRITRIRRTRRSTKRTGTRRRLTY
jgi:hypothetical protein